MLFLLWRFCCCLFVSLLLELLCCPHILRLKCFLRVWCCLRLRLIVSQNDFGIAGEVMWWWWWILLFFLVWPIRRAEFCSCVMVVLLEWCLPFLHPKYLDLCYFCVAGGCSCREWFVRLCVCLRMQLLSRWCW